MKKIKVLLITSLPWREDNNIGNSYSNLFGDIEEFEIAHIYCREGEPYNSKVFNYHQITEKRLVKNFFNKAIKPGRSFYMDASNNDKIEANSSMSNILRILRWELFFIIRDLIWSLGRWKDEDLFRFVEEFNPDVIWGTLTYMPNINIMMDTLYKRYKKPIVLYAWDDVYSFKHYSYNPLFWVRKIYQRYYIRKNVNNSSLIYTITKDMMNEYSNYFNKKCKLLYKGYDFNMSPIHNNTLDKPYRMVFMGNMGAGRWKALKKIVKVLADLNKVETIATIDIYSLSPRTKKMEKDLNIRGTSQLKEKVPQCEIMKILQDSDILVHVEPINKKDASFYRLSFSTKLVDYFYNAKCVLGIGKKTASLTYIEENNAGLVFYDCDEITIKEKLLYLFNNPELILDYGNNAWNCGATKHNRAVIKNMLIMDIKHIVSEAWI